MTDPQTIFIQNRKGQKMAVLVDETQNQKGLAFVMHGLGGNRDQPQIRTFGAAFKEKGFTVVYFDTTNTLGESEGAMEDATIGNYYSDLEDVLAWSREQSWYEEPFALTGHSLGGFCIVRYAVNYSDRVGMLAPISPFISGQLNAEAHKRFDPGMFEEWEASGWLIEESVSKPGVMKRLPWSHAQDRLNYDLLPHAKKLTMPIILIVGEKDHGTPPEHVRQLFDALPGPKEFHIIPGAPHTFRDAKHLAEIKKLMMDWIDKWTQ